MVSYDNIRVNQRVEVRWRGRIFRGTVKFKGTLNAQMGEWVGVALDRGVGDSDGMIDGRRYFSCERNHGIFTQAHEIRFLRLSRSSYSTYRSVRDEDELREELFSTQVPDVKNGPYDPISTSRSYSSLSSEEDWMAPPRQYTLTHSVGSRLPPALWKRPQTAHTSYSYRSTPIHAEYEDDRDDFISSPSIPIQHMPYQALRQQCRRGWHEPHTHPVREWSVHTGRDSVLYNSWNDF